MISAASGTYFNIKIKPDYVADTLVEVEADLTPYVDKYIMILDQSSRVYYVYQNDNKLQLVDAVDSQNYEVSPDNDPSLVVLGTFFAMENMSSGSIVNLVLDAGISKIRYADATLARPADGFILKAVHASESVVVYREGNNNSLGGLTYPSQYYLGTAGGMTLTPANPMDPLNIGMIVQKIAESINTTTASFSPEQPLYL